MTDRFEDAVRDAARGLANPAAIPSYHDAYRRGTRRRIVKRSALAAAGALVLVAALTVNLGRVPGNEANETDDVALDVVAATATVEPLATTAPVDVPDSAGQQAIDVPTPLAELATPTARNSTGAADADPGPSPTTSSDTAGPASPTPPPAPTAQPEPTSPPPTSAPTVEPQPTETPAVTATPFVLEVAPTATPEPLPTTSPRPEETAEPEVASTLVAPDNTDPSVAATVLADRPDATILGAPDGAGSACDVDADGVADAACRLLPDYGCSGPDDVRPGYAAFDDDEDGNPDACRAVGLTMCDTTGDGFADTPCVIELPE